jgi:hypothetical protein
MDYYHLSGGLLATGSIIEPGNWGRIIRAWGWQHPHALRELALEHARLSRFNHRPSRLESAFALMSLGEAKLFGQEPGFEKHLLYRVSLCDENAKSHVTDSRLCMPRGSFRSDWADVYWLNDADQPAAIPGVNWNDAIQGVQLREFLTLSPLRIEERLDR